ncbi:ABC-type Na+ efflux pump permease subunit [Epilithonimonas hungarica]|uniref:hypothetical protein n=1 Tax=Epilithonimonas hungarica TaxID=454006 RepID=UPI002783E048|nr:hypothetical protein [Epilithonimonas hungarica]MDP9956664.1 ABC-type Na+ efflux pump permease subunit [Epilithonimonas hungarica]
MKKTLLTLALAGIVLTANSCKKNESSEVKIDFTQSYEDAALALSTAQKNYEAALATNDPVKIEAAKKELQAAQEKYVQSKNAYVAEGGTVKTEYENYLTASTQVLGATASEAISNVVKGSDSIISGKVTTAVENKTAEVKNKLNAEKAKISEETKKTMADVKASADKTKEDFKKSADETKKTANEEIDKAKKSLNNLLGK